MESLMPPRNWIVLFILCTSLFFSGLSQAEESSQEATTSIVKVPSPQALQIDWWQYFSTAGDKFNQREKLFRQTLIEIEQQLEGEQKTSLSPLFDNITSALKNYQAIRSKTIESDSHRQIVKPHYSLDELLELHHQLKDRLLNKKISEDEQQQLAYSKEAADKQLDNKKIYYLDLDDNNPQKLALGLDIILSRLNLEVANKQLSLLKQRIKELAIQITFLNNALESAEQSLETDSKTIAEYQKNLQSAELGFAKTKNQYFEPFISITDDNPQSKLSRQKQLTEQVRIANAEVSVILSKLKLTLVMDAIPNTEAFLTQLKADEKQLDEFANKNKLWRKSTQQERDSARQSLLSNDNDNKQAIHQARLAITLDTLKQLDELDRLEQVQYLLSLVKKRLLKQQGKLASFIGGGKSFLANFSTLSKETFQTSLFDINETPVTTLSLLRVGMIIFIAWLISRAVRFSLNRLMSHRKNSNNSTIYALQKVLHYIILVIGLLVAISSIGVDLSKLALLASALSIGIGFGLQNVVSNFVAGLIILFEKSLKVGDFIEFGSGLAGEVRQINMRSTHIVTNDNVDIFIPNSDFVNGQVTNWTMYESFRRVHIPFGVAYGSDKDEVKLAALEAADAVDYTLKSTNDKHKAQVWMTGFGDSSLNFELIVWLTPAAVKLPGRVIATYTWELDTALARHNLEIPFPQRDLHLRSFYGLKDEQAINAQNKRATE
jgi:potassium efflux system protein